MTKDQVSKYAVAWRQREERERQEAEALRKEALKEARKAVLELARDFRIRKAVLFGSVLAPGRFRKDSDIDIAVEGLSAGDFWKACGRMMEHDFEIDLKPLEDLKGLIRERVDKGEVIYERPEGG